MPIRIFRLFLALKTQQKKTLLFSVFSLSQNNFVTVCEKRIVYHASGTNRQISPVRRVCFMSISR